ncbi:hypothetical protein [Pseudaestuariivita rosea]|nr:hypothetical protein [Pseudaestuariivita rosea]
MKRFIIIGLLLALAACGQPVQNDAGPDGGIGGTGTKSAEVR